jgi:protein KRI1
VGDSDDDSIPEDLNNLKQEKVLAVAQRKAKKEMNLVTDTDLLKRFYGDDSQLDQTDKFLRNYILLQCWKDKSGPGKSKVQEQIDKEDQAREEEMEAYEQKHNFRFEEGTGAYITTHQREVEDTMRRKDDKRRDARQEKKER